METKNILPTCTFYNLKQKNTVSTGETVLLYCKGKGYGFFAKKYSASSLPQFGLIGDANL